MTHNPPTLRTAAMPLERSQVYITPLGRRCTWVAGQEGRHAWFMFRYVDGRNQPTALNWQGFTLSRENLRILRLELPA
ncbi:MAG: hypothetical protein V4792_16465 [Pseudomonadota bacterium]